MDARSSLAVAACTLCGLLGSGLAAAQSTDSPKGGPVIQISPTTLTTVENGMPVDYRVTVSASPAPGETVTITPVSNDVTEGTASGALNFTQANWTIPQFVVVNPGAAGDGNDGDVMYTIDNNVMTTGGIYTGATAAGVDVTNSNVDGIATIIVDPSSSIEVSEDGVLTQVVTISTGPDITPSMDVSVDLTNGAPALLTVSMATVVLTAPSYSATVTLTGIADDVREADAPFSITTEPSVSAHAAFNGINPADITGVVLDSNVVSVTVTPSATPLSVSEDATTGTISYVLTAEPTAGVTINLSSSDIAEATVAPAMLMFTAANWDTPQVATVTGADDALVDGTQSFDINATTSSADPFWDGVSVATVAGETTDNDLVEADLSIVKSDSPDPVTAGSNLTYTIDVTNLGPADSTGASVTDVLPAGVSFVSSVGCTEAAGTVSCAIGALINGASQSVSFVVSVDPGQTAPISNVASVVGNEMDPVAANDSASTTTAVLASADLAISKDDGVSTGIPGQTVTYTIVANNAGPSDAPASVVADSFPAGCSSVSWTCSGSAGGTCSAAGTGAINDSADLPAGSSVTYVAVCSIDSMATGSLVNTATVATGAGVTDPNAVNNSATDTDALNPTADLAISKTDNLTTTQVNTSGSYVIVASNAGPSAAPGSTVTDTFPANFIAGAWTCAGAGGGVCPASGSGNIAASVDLPVGASVSFTVAGTYAGTIGVVSNTATVAAAATVMDPNAANNSATDTTEIVSPATLSGIKVGIANMTVVGGSLNYVIEFSNAGPQAQLDNPGAEMVDVLPFGYVYLSSSASSGTLSFDQPSRTLSWSGPVAVGQTISISVNGSIDPAVAGTSISNQAEFRYDADGNGSNEAVALSDDPGQPGIADPTVVGIAEAVQVPALSQLVLLLMGLLMVISGGALLRTRP